MIPSLPVTYAMGQHTCRSYASSSGRLVVTKTEHGTWLKVVLVLAEGNIVEYLFSDKMHGATVFTLYEREVTTKVPMTAVARRHQRYPKGCRVRLQ